MSDFLHSSKLGEKMARKVADKLPTLKNIMVENDKAYFAMITALEDVNLARKTKGKPYFEIEKTKSSTPVEENSEASREALKT